MKSHFKAIAGSILAAATMLTLVAGCGSSSSTSEASSSSTAKAKVSTPAIQTNGVLTVCAAFSTGNPPTYFNDSANNPVGAEVEMAKWIAKDLGLQVKFQDIAFASIIPALQAGKCDTIMSSLYIKPEREKVVDMIPYLMSGSEVAVKKGNPKNVTGMDDSLCGLKVSAAVGKTATLQAEAQAKQCTADNKSKLTVVQTDQTTAAVQQLVNGQVDAYVGETPVVLYYQSKQPDAFEMVGKEFGSITVGAAVTKGNTKLGDAIKASFASMNKSGDYNAILKKWNMSSLAYKF
ncbi:MULTISPECIES: ABC transporter substrate-binding protein [Bifidobacterium]|jgi:polar amino acid transport system substrate-binding protein|uniref:ABC transporter substrate-binding protein n=1 Tax=Bifidobacterium tibiigranuli TaxID=2172043 RepID=A0A5N6S3V0_9BIFI|nr:ABC transporter substrate-binding protein [Bifidobacterium tibiigranuli]KAE8128455.1 ABC transporter substrate-binding protein [Bifidobacterium tibiigranuli]KAE8128529.1 ABC transporter substrate-binding protein [Bifidobacterium tibiigranuli]MCH3974996.1 ABC transporter substrate-binding protein [Bifidobacterium tibiigranuli]MCH4189217.1 ABC transporter substrate-binding protein [Bifidobacterium tibiigranuli]MCH4202756.1 ABC transporter substrate-binding protein [Bifidobacterium tibiigranul